MIMFEESLETPKVNSVFFLELWVLKITAEMSLFFLDTFFIVDYFSERNLNKLLSDVLDERAVGYGFWNT